MIRLLQIIFLFKTSICSHKDILNWWNDISVEKPLKCNLNKQFWISNASSLFEKLSSEPYVLSRPCQEDDTMNYNYTFNGKKWNTTLEGLGKLKIISSEVFSDEEEQG